MIRKELNRFDVFFDNYTEFLEFGSYVKNTKGKMLRPALTILGAKIGGEVTQKSLWAALAVELMHNATLVHDDVVDNADLRRGQPTFKSIYGDKQAVLYGDYLLTKSLDCVIQTGELSIVSLIANTTGVMCIGEIDQLNHSGKLEISEQEYYDIIYKKTASLFECSMLIGYMSTGKSDLVDTIRDIAYNLGMAFQVKDDLLDYNLSGKSGKAYGNDIREQKMTLPLIYALENSEDKVVAEIKNLIHLSSFSDEDLLKVINFVNKKGGIDYTEQVLNQYLNKALAAIDQLPDETSKQEFKDLCQYLANRNN